MYEGSNHACQEVSGQARKDKAAKAATARALWVPATTITAALGDH